MTITANDHPYRVTAVDSASKYANDHPIKVEIEGGVVTPDEFEELEKKVDALATDLSYKGGVPSYADLPSDAATGDVYTTEDTGVLYVWDGDEWVGLNQSSSPVKVLFTEDRNSYDYIIGSIADFEALIASDDPVLIIPTSKTKTPFFLIKHNFGTTSSPSYRAIGFQRGSGEALSGLYEAYIGKGTDYYYIIQYAARAGLDNVSTLQTSFTSQDKRSYTAYAINKLITQVTTAPTVETYGESGQIYVDKTTGKIYICKGGTSHAYIWEEVGGGAQSDWNTSDNTDPSYVQNRPMYDEGIYINGLTFDKVIDSTTTISTDLGLTTETLDILVEAGVLAKSGDQYILDPNYMTNCNFRYTTNVKDYAYDNLANYTGYVGITTKGTLSGQAEYNPYSYTNKSLTLTKGGSGYWPLTEVSDLWTEKTGSISQNLAVIFRPEAIFLFVYSWGGFNGSSISSASFGEMVSQSSMIKKLHERFLPIAGQTTKGVMTTVQASNTPKVGSYLKKTTDGNGFGVYDIASAFVDWDEASSDSPAYIDNKPFGETPAGTTQTFTGTYDEMNLANDYIYVATWGDNYITPTDFLDLVGWQESDITSLGYSTSSLYMDMVFSGTYSYSGTTRVYGQKWKELPALIDAGYNEIQFTTVYQDWMSGTTEDITYKFTMEKVSEGVYMSSLSDLVQARDNDNSKLVRTFGIFKWGAIKNKVTLSSYVQTRYTIADDDVVLISYLYRYNDPVAVFGGSGGGIKNRTLTLSNSQALVKQIGAQYIPIDNDTIVNEDGILKAAGGSGGITTLTMADYNYPTTGTKDCIAYWLLEPGLYWIEKDVYVKSYSDATRYAYPYPTFLILIEANNGYNYMATTYSFSAPASLVSGIAYAVLGVKETGVRVDYARYLTSKNIENVLTSTATNNSLSAAQGKVLNDKIISLETSLSISNSEFNNLWENA